MTKQNKVIVFLLLGIFTIIGTTTTAIFVKGSRTSLASKNSPILIEQD